jgi:pilus assembly protein Flp/PilA
MQKIINFLNDESGASAAEYALILAIVGAGIAVAVIGLGEAITTAVGEASTCITDPNAANCGAAAPAPDPAP